MLGQSHESLFWVLAQLTVVFLAVKGWKNGGGSFQVYAILLIAPAIVCFFNFGKKNQKEEKGIDMNVVDVDGTIKSYGAMAPRVRSGMTFAVLLLLSRMNYSSNTGTGALNLGSIGSMGNVAFMMWQVVGFLWGSIVTSYLSQVTFLSLLGHDSDASIRPSFRNNFRLAGISILLLLFYHCCLCNLRQISMLLPGFLLGASSYSIALSNRHARHLTSELVPHLSLKRENSQLDQKHSDSLQSRDYALMYHSYFDALFLLLLACATISSSLASPVGDVTQQSFFVYPTAVFLSHRFVALFCGDSFLGLSSARNTDKDNLAPGLGIFGVIGGLLISGWSWLLLSNSKNNVWISYSAFGVMGMGYGYALLSVGNSSTEKLSNRSLLIKCIMSLPLLILFFSESGYFLSQQSQVFCLANFSMGLLLMVDYSFSFYIDAPSTVLLIHVLPSSSDLALKSGFMGALFATSAVIFTLGIKVIWNIFEIHARMNIYFPKLWLVEKIAIIFIVFICLFHRRITVSRNRHKGRHGTNSLWPCSENCCLSDPFLLTLVLGISGRALGFLTNRPFGGAETTYFFLWSQIFYLAVVNATGQKYMGKYIPFFGDSEPKFDELETLNSVLMSFSTSLFFVPLFLNT
jgi:hypothetical protein